MVGVVVGVEVEVKEEVIEDEEEEGDRIRETIERIEETCGLDSSMG